jgi:hypothetical protein
VVLLWWKENVLQCATAAVACCAALLMVQRSNELSCSPENKMEILEIIRNNVFGDTNN